jgi:hypothetical protein
MGLPFHTRRLLAFLKNHSSPRETKLPSAHPKVYEPKAPMTALDRSRRILQVPGVCEPAQRARRFREPHPLHSRTKLKLAQPITPFLKAT